MKMQNRKRKEVEFKHENITTVGKFEVLNQISRIDGIYAQISVGIGDFQPEIIEVKYAEEYGSCEYFIYGGREYVLYSDGSIQEV
jgi:hypothetical protein